MTGLNLRVDEILRAKIKSRDLKGVENPGAVARRDLERWYGSLKDALDQIKLAPAEAVLLIAVIGKESVHSEALAATLAMHVEESEEEGYGHVRNRLVQKIEHWDRTTRWAVIDACERYAVYAKRHPESTLGMALHQVGLHSYTATPEEMAVLEGTLVTAPAELDVDL
jgi:hypothetical protein